MQLKKYVKLPGFITKQIGDELILVPLSDQVVNMNEVFTMNVVGAFVWNCLDKPMSVDELSNEVAENFDIDLQTAFDDIKLFLEQICNKNMVKCV